MSLCVHSSPGIYRKGTFSDIHLQLLTEHHTVPFIFFKVTQGNTLTKTFEIVLHGILVICTRSIYSTFTKTGWGVGNACNTLLRGGTFPMQVATIR